MIDYDYLEFLIDISPARAVEYLCRNNVDYNAAVALLVCDCCNMSEAEIVE